MAGDWRRGDRATKAGNHMQRAHTLPARQGSSRPLPCADALHATLLLARSSRHDEAQAHCRRPAAAENPAPHPPAQPQACQRRRRRQVPLRRVQVARRRREVRVRAGAARRVRPGPRPPPHQLLREIGSNDFLLLDEPPAGCPIEALRRVRHAGPRRPRTRAARACRPEAFDMAGRPLLRAAHGNGQT